MVISERLRNNWHSALPEAIPLTGAWALLQAGSRVELIPLTVLCLVPAEMAELLRSEALIDILSEAEVLAFFRARRRPQ